ncbi:Acetoacetate decarboxylase (ADC) [Halogranum amylolyticum]|uniref:Acetoacetate decarboxylase (ADC) n=1 Tax=Halogranum amylolyticum TaxID=660520 RepID=A0A1H8RQ87_9EURY|nr:acetoacetate decarboxylase family protein [Halogranum amylolyticum]SEO68457.1 Acetoacetate decarboxylase (ADC) [Halogranum amylolyticum]
MTLPDHTATLSTGRRVDLPLRCEADVVGALFSADQRSLRGAVPEALTPVRVGPRRGVVVVVGVSYSQAGDFDPYDELAVIVPVARRTVAGVPRLDGGLGGYVVSLPVTTEESRRMGREIWGYPKTVADVEIRRESVADGGDEWHVDVREGGRDDDGCDGGDGTLALSLSVRETGRRPTREGTLDSYTVKEDRLWRTPVDVLGPVGLGLGGKNVSLSLERGRLAEDVRRLDVGRPLGRFTGRVRAHVQAGSAVE